MTAIIDQLFGGAAALALLFSAGYGPSLLLTPPALRRWFWLVTPLTGLAVAVVALDWLGMALPARQAAPVLLAISLALAALLHLRGVRPPSGQHRWEQLTVAAFLTAGVGLALIPMWDRPDLLSIGPNWDVEIYLPLAEYLKLHATGFSLDNPAGLPFSDHPNPLLWRVNFFDVRWAGLGFSQLHAAAGVLAGQDAHQNFAGLLSLLFGLSVAAGFLLLRVGFELERTPALLGTALLTISTPVLHIVYWSFGQHAASLPLLPLAVTGAAIALRGPDRRAGVWAGIGAAGLMAAYLPVVPLYGAWLAVYSCFVFSQSQGRGRVMLAAAVLVGTSLALAPWALVRAAMRGYHLLQDQGVAGLTAGPDVATFAPLGWAFGLFASPEVGFAAALPANSPVEGALTAAGRLLLLSLGGYGLYWAYRRRGLALVAGALAAVGLVLALRYGLNYPYGHLKVIASAVPLLVAPLVLGAEMAWRSGLAPRRRLALRGAVTSAGAIYLVLLGMSVSGLVASTREQSLMAFRGLDALGRSIPAGATVFVSSNLEYQGPKTGALMYFLRHTEVYGFAATGYSTFFRVRESGVYDYALFADKEAPQLELYPARSVVWQGGGLRLHRGPAGLDYSTDLGFAVAPPVVRRTAGHGPTAGIAIDRWTGEGYPVFTGWSPPLMGSLAETTPPETRYQETVRGHPQDVLIPSGGVTSPPPGSRELVVTIAGFREQDITVSVNGSAEALTVKPGLTSYPLRSGRLPAQITIQNENTQPVFVKSVQVRRPSAPPSEVRSHSEAVLVRWNGRVREDGLQLAVDYFGPRYSPVLDVYGADGAQHYGYWQLPVGRTDRMRRFRMRLDPARQDLALMRQASEVRLDGWRGEGPDGEYQAYFVLWDGQQVARQVPLCRFALEARKVAAVTDRPSGLYIG